MEKDCIFCTLAASDSKKLFDDKDCFVIPDRYPSSYGHLLVISKEHNNDMLEAPDETVSKMFIVAKKYGLLLREKLGADGICINSNIGKEAGQIIFHMHIHVTPKYITKKIGFMPHRELTEEESGKLFKLLSG